MDRRSESTYSSVCLFLIKLQKPGFWLLKLNRLYKNRNNALFFCYIPLQLTFHWQRKFKQCTTCNNDCDFKSAKLHKVGFALVFAESRFSSDNTMVLISCVLTVQPDLCLRLCFATCQKPVFSWPFSQFWSDCV